MSGEGDKLRHFQYNGGDVLSVPAQMRYFAQIEAWLDELCDEMNVSPEIRTHLQISADEIFMNICSYAYPDQQNGGPISLACSLDLTDRTLQLKFSDQGVPFDPLKQPEPEKARLHQKGGVGLLMVRKFADALKYERLDNNNILTFLKKI